MTEGMVWIVWAESGAYEQFSAGMCGIFADETLANAHADRLRKPAYGYSYVGVLTEPVLTALPGTKETQT